MDELIEALQIFLKYDNNKYPTACDHDILYVFVNPSAVSSDDIETLANLGFLPSEGGTCFISFRYGSA